MNGFEITTSFWDFLFSQIEDMDRPYENYLFYNTVTEIHFRNKVAIYSVRVVNKSRTGPISLNTCYFLTGYLGSRFDLDIRYKLDTMYDRSRVIEDMRIKSNDSSIEHMIRMNHMYLPLIDHISHRFHINIREGKIKHELTNDLRFIHKIVLGYTDIALLMEQKNKSRFMQIRDMDINKIRGYNSGNLCIICFKPVKHDAILMQCCDHYVHKDHLAMWIKRKNTCPFCGEKHPSINCLAIGLINT